MNAASIQAADVLFRVVCSVASTAAGRALPYLAPTCSICAIAPLQRREYDSTDDFDDSLPTECLPADFYKVSLWVAQVPCLRLFEGQLVSLPCCAAPCRAMLRHAARQGYAILGRGAVSMHCIPTNPATLPASNLPRLRYRCLAPRSAAIAAGR